MTPFAAFCNLVHLLGSSTKTNEKLQALAQYFASATDADKVWVIALFSGRRPKRLVSSTTLQLWCTEITALPLWLFEESYHTVGDLGETIALLLPPPEGEPTCTSLSAFMLQMQALQAADEAEKKAFIITNWKALNTNERFVFNKLMSGGFRIGVSQKTIVNALAKTIALDAAVIAHCISGNWNPATTAFETLLQPNATQFDDSKPYPFYLAYPLEEAPANLGEPKAWQAEWKWDGIRGQIIQRNQQLYVWSRGEELMTDKFPEYQALQSLLPNGTVMDGEIIPAIDGKPLPFAVMQTRIGRKTITKKQLQTAPITFFAYDLLEWQGQDIRTWPLQQRRSLLEQLVAQVQHPALLLSPTIAFESWDALIALRQMSREHLAEGIMLKRLQSAYQVGRKVGDWWKWKVDPLSIDAVLIYAQKGHGRRSNLYTDYTFAVRDGDTLVSFAKAYSGLTDKEFAAVDAFVKANSIEKFGPVRTVKPALVFEIGFEGIAASNRHKSGVALRFPRMLRWRHDKTINDINTLNDLKQLLALYNSGEKN